MYFTSNQKTKRIAMILFSLGFFAAVLLFVMYNMALKYLLKKGKLAVEQGNEIIEQYNQVALDLYELEKEIYGH